MISQGKTKGMAIDLKAVTKGTLCKWTNYVHGWQQRYFILKNGILMYHKSEQETSFGCRGAIAVKASTLTLHEFDCCRFDVGVCDYVWYLRAETKEARNKWIRALQEQAYAFAHEETRPLQEEEEQEQEQEKEKEPKQEQEQPQPPQEQQDQQHLQYSDSEEKFEDPILTDSDLNPNLDPEWLKIDQLTRDQLYYAQLGLGQQGTMDGWQLFAEDGQMRLYTRELEIDGLVCDPLKAVHVVKGVTGYEMCHRFFSPNTRFEWEQTLESMKVVKEINKDTLVFHQIHKRIWPAAQRDAVFWSHIRKIDEPKASCLSKDDVNPVTCPDIKLHNVWLVCNNSTDNPEIPVSIYVTSTSNKYCSI